LRVNNMDAARLASVCVLANDYRQAFLQGAGFTRLELASDGMQNVNKFINGRCDLIASTEIGLYTKLQALGYAPASVQRLLPLVGLEARCMPPLPRVRPPGWLKPSDKPLRTSIDITKPAIRPALCWGE
jgi:polar amino acid transport system substrate-binding protein